MTISEMHSWFRQYAQQMGMQNVRAILPEQIDNLINTSTKDIIDEVINRNVGTTNDRVITDNAKLANVNALRTLYKVCTIVIYEENGEVGSFTPKPVSDYGNTPYVIDSSDIADALYYVDFSIRYTAADNSGITNPYGVMMTAKAAYEADPTDAAKKAAYETAMAALKTAIEVTNKADLTRWFPVRIIDDTYLADVLNDWVLAPRMRTPAMVVYANDSDTGSTFELYVGENQETAVASIAATKALGELRCSYIKKPREVKYVSDLGGSNVNSDLPEQLQIPMLKHAVDLYRITIQGSLYANQQNAQQAQQEMVRNNARPDNEGYQS